MAANLESRISLDATKFQAGLRSAGASAKKFSKSVTAGVLGAARSIGNIASTLAKVTVAFGIAGAAAAAMGLKNAFDLGGTLSDFSARTGIAVEKLVVLQRALEDNGISGDKVATIINKMQKSIGELGQGLATQVRAFEELGITLEQLQRLSPEDQFELLQRSIAGVSDEAKRATLSAQIFGARLGNELLTLVKDAGALERAAQSVGKQAEILARNAQTFDRISDLLNGAGQKLQGFFVGFAEIAAGPVLTMLEKFDQLDLAGAGQRFGAAIKPALESLVSKIGDAQALMASVGESLINGINIFTEAWRSEQMTNLIGLTIEVGFLKGVEGAKQGIIEILSSAINRVLRPFQGGDTDAVVQYRMGMAAAGKELRPDQIAALNDRSGQVGRLSPERLAEASGELAGLTESLLASAKARQAAEQEKRDAEKPKPSKPAIESELFPSITAVIGDAIKKIAASIKINGTKASSEISKAGSAVSTALVGVSQNIEDVAEGFQGSVRVINETTSRLDDNLDYMQRITDSALNYLQGSGLTDPMAGKEARLIKEGERIGSGQGAMIAAQRGQAMINAQDPVFHETVRRAQTFFAENILPTGGMMAQQLMREIETSGWTKSVLDRVQSLMGERDPATGLVRARPEPEPIPEAKPQWGRLLADALGVQERFAPGMGPQTRWADPYGRQSYEAQRQANQLAKKNQSELQGINNRLGSLGLIGA